MRTAGFDPRAHLRLVRLVVHTPRKVVNAADAPSAAAGAGHLADVDAFAGGAIAQAIAVPSVLTAYVTKAHSMLKKRRGDRQARLAHSGTLKAANLMLARHRTSGPGRERSRHRASTFHQRDAKAVRVHDRQGLFAEALVRSANRHSVTLQTTAPETEAVGRHRQ